MFARTANEYLDANESEDHSSNGGYEVLEDSRTAGLRTRSRKKRKLSNDPTDEEHDVNEQSRTDESLKHIATNEQDIQQASFGNAAVHSSGIVEPARGTIFKRTSVTKKSSHPGVIYLSRIPPFMRPTTVRSLLSAYGPISQLFLTPEAPSTYLARKHAKGNKKRSFIDGWIEFVHKRHAKACVDAINGKIVGGKKGGWYRDDVWNAKYLSGFKWADLMEGVRREEREREERVRVGVSRDKREREEFLRGIEGAKVEETRRKKDLNKRDIQEGGSANICHDDKNIVDGEGAGKSRNQGMRFRQNEVKSRFQGGPEQASETSRVLGKIF